MLNTIFLIYFQNEILKKSFFTAYFGVLLGLRGIFTPSSVALGDKIQAGAQALYGYGYVIPFALEYEANRLDCGVRDFDKAIEVIQTHL